MILWENTLFWNTGNIVTTHHHEGEPNFLSVSCTSLSLLPGDRLWGKSPRTSQDDLQESQPDPQSQPYKRWGDRSPPQAKAGMDMEPILCTGGAHWTRCAVCRKGRKCTLIIVLCTLKMPLEDLKYYILHMC